MGRKEAITFNSGRVWKKFNYSVDTYLGALANVAFTSGTSQGGISPEFAQANERLKEIQKAAIENEKIAFSIEELTIAAILNSSGALLYLDTKTNADREKVFFECTGRKPEFYRHNTDGSYEKVSSYDDGGFFKGKVFSEADFSFSTKPYSNYDFIDVANTAMVVGTVVITAIFVAELVPAVIADIQCIRYMWQNYGVRYSYNMYRAVGYEGIVSIIQVDMMDGDSILDDAVVISQTGVFKGIDEKALKKKYHDHIFSDKHVTNGIRDMGTSDDDIMNSGLKIIKALDAQGKIKEGPTQIKTYINGFEAEVRMFTTKGKIISFDMFKTWSGEDKGNTIYFGGLQ